MMFLDPGYTRSESIQGRLRTPMKALRKPILKELNWLRDRKGMVKGNSKELPQG